MKISYNWLKKYLDIDFPADEVSEVLTDIGLEVEGLESYKGPGNGLEGLVVGQVKEVTKHPDADNLKITKVDIGSEELLQIVCGAPNVEVGQKVVVATVGSTLFPSETDSFKIKKAKIRGVESLGMICAEDEIGLGKNHDGIIVLKHKAKVGQSVKEYFGLKDDFIFEIGLTPNRSDATGHIGVARDLAAALTVRKGETFNVQYPSVNDLDLIDDLPIEVEVENTDACPRYTGVVIRDITVKQSPSWLIQRLESIGVKPINNIVDITNYILHEYGQPIHAFNYDAIKGNKVIVKNLKEGTIFTTLDEKERKLSSKDLMICNAEEGMCIAGVFGGDKSGVKEDTTNIFIESAYFEPVSVRKTSGRHNLRTDAAIRFEKGTDPNITITALKRAAKLVRKLAGGEVASKIIDIFPRKIDYFQVNLDYEYLDRLIGIEIDRNIIKQILEQLEIFVAMEHPHGLKLFVPPYRTDVQRPADVAEEILRIYGFNQIPFPKQFRASLSHKAHPDKNGTFEKVADYLAYNGFNEMVTNSITSGENIDKLFPENSNRKVNLLSSSNAGLNVLRNSMLLTGLEAVAFNINRRNTDLKLFDFGKIYSKAIDDKYNKGKYIEKEQLALFVTGSKQSESWNSTKENIDFYYLKSIVKNILKRAGVNDFTSVEANNQLLDYGLNFKNNDNLLVEFGKVSEKARKLFDIKQDIFYAEINWADVFRLTNKHQISFNEISKYPGTQRDLALLLDKKKTFKQVEEIAIKEGRKLLKSVNLFDVYEDKKLGDKKSYGVSFVFEDEKKTIKDKDVDKIIERLIMRYTDELGAEIR